MAFGEKHERHNALLLLAMIGERKGRPDAYKLPGWSVPLRGVGLGLHAQMSYELYNRLACSHELRIVQ